MQKLQNEICFVHWLMRIYPTGGSLRPPAGSSFERLRVAQGGAVPLNKHRRSTGMDVDGLTPSGQTWLEAMDHRKFADFPSVKLPLMVDFPASHVTDKTRG